MARKHKRPGVHRGNVLSVIDEEIAQEVLEDARREAAPKPSEENENIGYAKYKASRTSRLYRNTFVSGYKNLVALGISEATIARLFGLNRHAFANIKQNGDKGIKKAYEEAMAELESVLTVNILKQAVGYEYTEVKTTYEPRNLAKQPDAPRFNNKKPFRKNIKPSKVMMKTKVEETKKHIPGKPKLLMYYMATHFPERWKLTSADDGGGLHFHITGDIVGQQINDLAGKYLAASSKVIDNEIVEDSDSE